MKVHKSDLLSLLELYQAKAACHHTEARTGRIWKRLASMLTEKERADISIGLSHWQIGLGREEFDYECNKVKASRGLAKGQ